MAIKDEVKKEQEKLKDKPFSYKLKYFFDYYKIPVIIVIFVIIFSALLLKDVRREKLGYRIYGTFINANTASDSKGISEDFENYLTAHAEDPTADTRPVQIDTSMTLNPESADQASMTTSMKTIAMIEANRLDFILSDQGAFEYFSNDGVCENLEILMPDAVASADEDDLLYGPTYDGKMGVAGIKVKNSSILKAYDMFTDSDCYFGIIANNPNPGNAPLFYEFLTE